MIPLDREIESIILGRLKEIQICEYREVKIVIINKARLDEFKDKVMKDIKWIIGTNLLEGIGEESGKRANELVENPQTINDKVEVPNDKIKIGLTRAKLLIDRLLFNS